MGDIVVVIILLVVIGAAVAYIIREKKKGVQCIGCPSAASCAKKCRNASGCSCNHQANPHN